MIRFEDRIKVRYYDCDHMGVMHHSNYLRYFECARDEMISSWGYGIEKCQADGIVFPVAGVQIKYHASAKIGDTLRVTADIESMPLAKLIVKQAVYNQDGVLCAEGVVTLGFLNSNTGRIMACPEQFRKLMEKYDK